MTDLTKITTPFGLLDAETQEALRAHGGPYEWWRGAWEDVEPMWGKTTTYRVKPQPPKPREWWAVQTIGAPLHVGMWPNKADAERAASDVKGLTEIIHVREVV